MKKIVNKRNLSVVTTAAMVASVAAPFAAPTAVDAKSENNVDRVVTVTTDTYLDGDEAIQPKLIIEAEDGTFGKTETFRVQLGGSAEWKNMPSVVNADQGSATITRLTDQIIEVTWSDDADIADGKKLQLPLSVDVKGSSGEVKVTVDPRDSAVTGGSYTFAVVQSGSTTATVGKKETVNRGTSKAADIIIDETVTGSLVAGKVQKLRLRLPSDVEWTDGTDIEFRGGFDDNYEITKFEIDERTLDFEFKVIEPTNVRGSIIISPEINVKRDASHGDITVNLTGRGGDISSASGLVIAEYRDYSVSATIEEVKEIISGRDLDEYRTAKIKIKENVEGSLVDGRVIDFELPAGVKIPESETISVTNSKGLKNVSDSSFSRYSKDSKFEFEVEHDGTSGKRELEFELPITASADFEGEITLNISGAGIPEQELVIAEAVKPVSVEVKLSDVRLGVQGQRAPEIIIKENVAGAIEKTDGDDLILEFVNDQGFRFDSAKFEVVEGNIDIDQDTSKRKGDNKKLAINLKSESDKASTIKVTGVTMTVDRTAPEGKVQVDVKGDGVVQNKTYEIKVEDKTITKEYADFSSRVDRFDFANVITPAPGEVRSTSTFVIGSTTYTVVQDGNSVEKTADVAPFIENGRTYLPVRFVADALGVTEDNIIWNDAARTVTLIKGDRVTQMTIGSNLLTVNGVAIPMDVNAIIKDDRTFLPLRYAAQALGAEIEWDDAERTVTVKN